MTVIFFFSFKTVCCFSEENWAYQGKFDEHGMEQLFYFVLLQKTLKSCLAIINTINIDERDEVMALQKYAIIVTVIS